MNRKLSQTNLNNSKDIKLMNDNIAIENDIIDSKETINNLNIDSSEKLKQLKYPFPDTEREDCVDKCKIYLLTNMINGKIYIGQTWLELWRRMRSYDNSIYLHSAIIKYGKENFKYEILWICNNQEEADEIEKYYIEKYNSRDNSIGYNLKEGGRGGRHSEETKAKISQAQIGRVVSDETRQKISDIHTGLKNRLTPMSGKKTTQSS